MVNKCEEFTTLPISKFMEMYEGIPKDHVSVNLPYIDTQENLSEQKVVPMRLKKNTEEKLKKSTEEIMKRKEDAFSWSRSRKRTEKSNSKEDHSFNEEDGRDDKHAKSVIGRETKRAKRDEEESEEPDDDFVMNNIIPVECKTTNSNGKYPKPFEYFPYLKTPGQKNLVKDQQVESKKSHNEVVEQKTEQKVEQHQHVISPESKMNKEEFNKSPNSIIKGIDFNSLTSPLRQLNNSSRIIPKAIFQNPLSRTNFAKQMQDLEGVGYENPPSAFERASPNYGFLKSPGLLMKGLNSNYSQNMSHSPINPVEGQVFNESPLMPGFYKNGTPVIQNLGRQISSNFVSPIIPQIVKKPGEKELKNAPNAASSDDEGFDEMKKILQNSKPEELDDQCTQKMQKRKKKLNGRLKKKLKIL